MATIMDVARLSGFSKTTVSRVINSNGPVSKETKIKIEEAMHKLNYTPNYFAQGMRTNRTRTIALLAPDYSNPFYPELFKSVEEVARQNGYMIILCNTAEEADRELAYIKEIVKRNIDGIIFCTYNRIRENIDYLIRISKEIPVVFMDQVVDDEEERINYVVTDGFTSTRKATAYLIQKGRKRIAYIKGSSRHRVTKERYNGYKQALIDYGIQFDSSLTYTSDFHIESGFMAARELMSRDDPPDAIMAVSDAVAIGAIKYLKYAGISVPDKVNVIGFDNIFLSTLIEPALTTISQPIEELGREAVNIVINKINNPEFPDKQIKLEGELIIRRSSEGKEPEIIGIEA